MADILSQEELDDLLGQLTLEEEVGCRSPLYLAHIVPDMHLGEDEVGFGEMDKEQLIKMVIALRMFVYRLQEVISNISRSVDVSLHSEKTTLFILNQKISRLGISEEVCAKLSEIGIVFIGDLCAGHKEGLVFLLEMLGVEDPEGEAEEIELDLNNLHLFFIG